MNTSCVQKDGDEERDVCIRQWTRRKVLHSWVPQRTPDYQSLDVPSVSRTNRPRAAELLVLTVCRRPCYCPRLQVTGSGCTCRPLLHNRPVPQHGQQCAPKARALLAYFKAKWCEKHSSAMRTWQHGASATQFCPDYYFGSRVLQRQYSATLIWQSASATEFCHAYLTECFSDPVPGHDYLTAECFSDNILPCLSDRVLQRPNSAMLIWKSASVTQFCHAYLTECFSDPIPGHDYLTAEYFSNNILPCLIDRVLQRPISAMLIWQSASATQFCHAYLTECVSDAVLPRLSDRVRQRRSSAMFIWQNASVTQFGHAYLTECFSDPIRPWVFVSRVLQQLSSATCIRQWVHQWPSSAVQIWQQSAPKIQLWNTDLTEECFIDKILHFSVSVQFLKHYSSTFIWQRFNISLLFWQQSVSRTQFCNSQ